MKFFLINLLVLFSLDCFAQEAGGFSFGYGGVFTNNMELDTWLENFNASKNFTSELDSPDILSGISIGFIYSNERIDLAMRYNSRSKRYNVTSEEQSGETSDFKYKVKYNIWQIPEIVFYPGQVNFGIGTSIDGGSFKIGEKETDVDAFYTNVRRSFILGNQFIARLRIMEESSMFSITGFYQVSYLDVDWSLFDGSTKQSYKPSGFGFRVEMTFYFN